MGQAGAGCSAGAPGGNGGWGYGIAGAGGDAGPSGCSGSGGGGGGSSAVTRAATLLIAASGGGGGGGGGCTSVGGFGGYGITNGSNTSCTSGGATAGSGNPNGTNGGTINQDGGGGGGGGGGALNGGNGGSAPPAGPSCNSANDCGAGGGGAGDSFVPVGGTLANGAGQTPGNSGDPDLCGGCAAGGNNQSGGGNGTVVIILNSTPAAAFTATSVCYGNPVAFIDQSCNTVVSWAWDFGDSSPIVITQNPSHNYAAPGAYTITLIATDSLGVSDTAQNTIDIHQLPVADFLAANICSYYNAIFTDNTFYSPGTVTWQWDFDDGQTSTLQNPTNSYASEGAYQVTLIATTDSGCTDTIIKTIYVHPVPQASFTLGNTCLYNPALFVDNSTLSNGTFSWNWDFGDGQVSTLQNPSHLYTSEGNFTVTLIVTSDSGCTDTTQQAITIYPIPVADFETTNVCTGDIATFNDLSNISSGAIASWLWSFGDGFTSTQQNPTHVYTTYGTDSVELIVTSDNNCVDTETKSIVIHPLPQASFTVQDVCVYDAAIFDNTSSIVLGAIATYGWDFGDALISTQMSPSHLYNTEGTYTVILVVISDMGCMDMVTNPVEISPKPQAFFNADVMKGCSPLCVQFTELYVAGPIITNWYWEYGDGSTSTLQVPVPHCYLNGTVNQINFDVQLVVTSSDGCSDTLKIPDMIEVWPNPIAEFTMTPDPATILYPYITFSNLSVGAVDSSTVYTWDFGDSTNFWFGYDTVHVYNDYTPGSFLIELFVTNSFGCVDSITDTLEIDNDYTLFAPNAFTPNGDGINDYFQVTGIGLDNLVEFEFSIYNRWGDRIYFYNQPNDPSWKGWDGIGNNGKKSAQNEVYIWVIETRDALNKWDSRHKYVGYVSLIH